MSDNTQDSEIMTAGEVHTVAIENGAQIIKVQTVVPGYKQLLAPSMA